MNKILNFKDFIVETNKKELDLIKKELWKKEQTSLISNNSDDNKNDDILIINKKKEKKLNKLEKESMNNHPILNHDNEQTDNLRYCVTNKNIKENKPIDFNLCEIFLIIFNCGKKLKHKNIL